MCPHAETAQSRRAGAAGTPTVNTDRGHPGLAMRHLSVAAVTLLATVALVTAGCGAPSGLAPKTYAHQACGAVAAFEGSLSSQAGTYAKAVDAAKGDPAAVKTAAVTFLQEQVTGSAQLLNAVRELRRPAGSGGQDVQDALVGAAQSAQETFQTQEMRVAATAPTDRTALFAILDTAQRQIGVAGQALATGIESVGKYGDQQLNDAFADDDVCSGLAGARS